MQVLIDERHIMKRETSERLYTEGAHILSSFLVTVPLCLLGATLQVLIIYAFSQLALKYLPTFGGWVLLLFLNFDDYYYYFYGHSWASSDRSTYEARWVQAHLRSSCLTAGK